MPELHDKFVLFNKWCKHCVHSEKKENEEPCDHCLEEPINTDSHKPVLFKQKDNEEQEEKV